MSRRVRSSRGGEVTRGGEIKWGGGRLRGHVAHGRYGARGKPRSVWAGRGARAGTVASWRRVPAVRVTDLSAGCRTALRVPLVLSSVCCIGIWVSQMRFSSLTWVSHVVGPDQLTAWADASKVAPRHSAVTRVVFLAQADIPLQDLLPALLPRGGVCEQSHTCEVLGLLGKTRALDGEDPGAAGAEGGQERPTGRNSAGAVPVERAVSN